MTIWRGHFFRNRVSAYNSEDKAETPISLLLSYFGDMNDQDMTLSDFFGVGLRSGKDYIWLTLAVKLGDGSFYVRRHRQSTLRILPAQDFTRIQHKLQSLSDFLQPNADLLEVDDMSGWAETAMLDINRFFEARYHILPISAAGSDQHTVFAITPRSYLPNQDLWDYFLQPQQVRVLGVAIQETHSDSVVFPRCDRRSSQIPVVLSSFNQYWQRMSTVQFRWPRLDYPRIQVNSRHFKRPIQWLLLSATLALLLCVSTFPPVMSYWALSADWALRLGIAATVQLLLTALLSLYCATRVIYPLPELSEHLERLFQPLPASACSPKPSWTQWLRACCVSRPSADELRSSSTSSVVMPQ